MQALTSPVKTKRTHQIRFIVRGTGTFPLDMLRYDSCHFLLAEDARIAARTIAGTYRDQHFYALASYQDHAKWEPTVRRWASFGFEVCVLTADHKFLSSARLRPA